MRASGSLPPGSAPGVDGWTYCDLALLPDSALEVLAQFFGALENGAPWPSAMVRVRAVLLPKDPDDPADPMAYRVLKITSAIYRLWAGTRLYQMRPWVQTWDHPALVAGTQGRSAQDGW